MRLTAMFLLATTTMAVAVPISAQTLPSAPPEEPVVEGNEIVVTASKRDERLQDAPVAITALDGDQMRNIGAQSFRDYASLVPGLSQRDNGNPGQGTVILRGLNTGAQSLTNTAATYIGEIPFSASGFLSAGSLLTADPDINNVERIEVLKGPQGTLFGANSLGGLIRIIPHAPDTTKLALSASIEGTTVEGGSQGFAVRGSVNLPIVDGKVAVVANGLYRDAPGWTDNVGTNTSDVNRSIIKGGRVAIRFTPTEEFTVDLSGTMQDIDNRGYAYQDNIQFTTTPLYGENKYFQAQNLGGKLQYRLAAGTATYDFGPVALIGSASYGTYRTDLSTDATLTYIGLARSLSPTIAAAIPVNGIGSFNASPNMDKFSAEVRLVSERLGSFEFVAGGFYTDERNKYRTVISVANANGTPLTAPFDVLLRATTTSNYKEVAAFGNLTFYLTDTFDVTGGLRVGRNTQFAQTGGPNAITFYAPRATANFNFEESVTTYLANIRWRPSRNISLYARAASGFRPGGPQNNPAPPAGTQTIIRPDTVWNYEAGVKATALDGQVTINASAYRLDWKDIQLNTTFNGIVLQANGGRARVEGFEFELGLRPTRLLTVATSVGYTDARLTQVDAGVQTNVGAAPGDSLPLTPKWTVAMVADQRVPFSGSVEGRFGATLRFRSDMPSNYPGALLNRNVKIPSLTTLDLRAGMKFGQFGVQVRADNVLNASGFTSLTSDRLAVTQSLPSVGSVIRSRSYTLALTADF